MRDYFDIVDTAYCYFDDKYDDKDLDAFDDNARVFAAIEAYAEYLNDNVEDLYTLGVDTLTDYLATHKPTSLLWCKDIIPILADLTQHIRNAFYRFEHPQSKQRIAITYTKMDQMIYHLIWRVVL